jgi:ferredoxin
MGEIQERQISGLTVRIEREICIGSANCTKLAGDVFVLDPEGIVTFRPEAPDIERERLLEACGVCPVDALVVLDAAGTRLVP